MIKAEDKFSVTNRKGRYLLSTKRSDRFEITGASFDLGVVTGSNQCHRFIMIELPEDAHNELIIVNVESNMAWDHAFIMVDVRKSEPFNLKEFIFLPDIDAIYNFNRSYIEVKINGVIFTSDPKNKNPEKRYIDCDTLCRYLVHKVTAGEVEAAAQEVQDKISARDQLAEIERKFKELKADIATLEAENFALEDEKLVIESEAVKYKDTITRALTHVDNEFGARKRSLNTVKRILTGESKPESTLQ